MLCVKATSAAAWAPRVPVRHGVGDADDVNRTGQEEAEAARRREVDAREAPPGRRGTADLAECSLEHLGHTDCSQNLARKVGHVVREDVCAGGGACVREEFGHRVVSKAQG